MLKSRLRSGSLKRKVRGCEWIRRKRNTVPRKNLTGALLMLLACPLIPAGAQTPTLAGNNAFTGTNTFPVINNILYVDGVKHTTLASAIAACPSKGCIIYTTVPEAWTSNVLGTAPLGTHIYFGAGNWTTAVTQTIPSNVIITGESGRNAGQQGSAIQAAATFPTTGAPVIQLGPGGGAIQESRIETMTVDCNNIADATGIYDNQAQEKSGARDVLVTACPGVGIDIESGGQSSVWTNLEVFANSWSNSCSHCSSSTLLLKMNDSANVTLNNISLIGSGPAVLPSIAAQISASGVNFDGSIHCEGVSSTCYNISGANVRMSHVNCSRGAASLLPNCIVIQPISQNIYLDSIGVDGYTTNIIDDLQNSFVLTGSGEGQSVAEYITGNGSTQPVITSSVNHTSRISSLKVEGNLSVGGTITKGGGSFKIDDPLDPTHKYLSHSFVESPDMMNIYNGTITLDKKGEAVVKLPNYFGALNRDFRYQLTPIGGYAPIYIAQEVKNNVFRIAGGKPGLRVSWEVTGIRQDDYANKHRIQVEEEKEPEVH